MASGARVHLIDDRALFRDALRGLLEREGVRVVGESGDPLQAAAEVVASGPDVVIAEVRFRSTDGLSLLQSVTAAAPATPLVVHSGSRDAADVIDSLRAGAQAYVLKEDEISHLVAAIAAARVGDGYMSPEIAAVVIDFVRRGDVPSTQSSTRVSERELEVLQLIALGLDNRQIGLQLGISDRTVKNHVAHILRKLELENRVQAAVFAVRSGLA